MLDIRRLCNKDEVTDARKIDTLVFNGRQDFTKADDKPDPLARPDRWYWGAYEDGKLVSTMVEIEYLMRFDGHDARMSGIGGVGTLAEARRGGKIRQIFDRLFAEAYESGVVFSCLTPFSHAFYRQFGYEICSIRNRVSAPVRLFERRKYKGSFTQIFPGDDTAALHTVHTAYIADLNHAIRRDYWPDNIAWRIFTKKDPYNTGGQLYLWRDEAGVPRAYIKYQHEHDKNGDNTMNTSELAFTDREALGAVLAFVGALSAQMKTFVWEMPSYLEATDFLDVAWDIEQRLVPRDMTRIVNVKAALEKMRRPSGSGSFVVETVDPILSVNSARWLVEYDAGGSAVTVTDRDADIVCDMPAFAQLVMGYRTLDNMLLTARSGVEVRGDLAALRSVFTTRPQYLTEYF